MPQKFLVFDQVSVPGAGGDPVLDKIDLTPNGAGKSTLLSLITADNSQAHANEICISIATPPAGK